jgi:ribosomal protein S17
LSILPKGAPIINEVRRRGVISDRYKSEEEIQIRVGDLIAIYETKHIPSEM